MNESSIRLTQRQAQLISAATGFLALSWEIVWMRLYNFTTASRAIAFGAMLGSYLLGLALGSLWSRKWQAVQHCNLSSGAGWITLARLIRRANLNAFLVVPIVSWCAVVMWWPWTLILVIFGAAMLGTVLPLLCHLAIPPDEHAGRRMSGIYLANILGSGAGSLLTGFVLMEYCSLKWLSLILLLGSEAMVWLLLRQVSGVVRTRLMPHMLTLICVIAGLAASSGIWGRLQYRGDYTWGMTFPTVIESKHGVITVDTKGTIYGNGTYDGSLDTSLHEGSWLVRPYFVSAALHPNPRRVLVIGVSGGAWTQILAYHPDVEEVIGVEISDAYLRLIRDSPSVSSLLTNPKVHLVIDDGRRWLRHHPDERFDLIVMNTTHHWREFASTLLSQDFLTLANAHLREGGNVAWYCTESARAAKTGMTVFPHTLMAMNFCVGSESPITPDKEHWRRALEKWSIDGKPVFDLTREEGRGELERVLAYAGNEGEWDADHRWRWMNRARMERRFSDAELITDDTLGHEFAWGNW
jgi:predicted membrane-bound spermidine synthase